MSRNTGMLFAGEEVEVGTTPPETPRETARETTRPTLLKGIGLLIGGPLLGLLYVIFLPVLGLGTLGWVIGKALRNKLARRPIGG